MIKYVMGSSRLKCYTELSVCGELYLIDRLDNHLVFDMPLDDFMALPTCELLIKSRNEISSISAKVSIVVEVEIQDFVSHTIPNILQLNGVQPSISRNSGFPPYDFLCSHTTFFRCKECKILLRFPTSMAHGRRMGHCGTFGAIKNGLIYLSYTGDLATSLLVDRCRFRR